MIANIQAQIDAYLAWLRQGITVRQVTESWAEITTPYLDRHNDHLQLYIRKDGDTYEMTDDGYILSDLDASGCTLSTPRRQALRDMVLNGFGIECRNEKLLVTTSAREFPRRIHNFVQGMLAINDLFATARSTVASLFYEDVVSWLDEIEVRYTPNVRFMGKSRYEHTFDFIIPRSRKAPERFIQTINKPSREAAQRLAFAWQDTRETRNKDTLAYAMINDAEKFVPEDVQAALKAYDITPVPWKIKEQFHDALVA